MLYINYLSATSWQHSSGNNSSLLPAEVRSGDFLGGGGGEGGGEDEGGGGAGLDLGLLGLATSVFDLMDLTGDSLLAALESSASSCITTVRSELELFLGGTCDFLDALGIISSLL